MKLRFTTANRLLADLTADLAGGQLKVYDGDPSRTPSPALLVSVLLPAFDAPVAGRASALDISPSIVDESGEAQWASLVTAGDEVVGELLIRARTADDVREADIVVDRTDLQRGGLFVIDKFVLQLPTRA